MLHKVSLPIQLIITLISVIICSQFLPLYAVEIFYTTSLILKECLGFLLPFMIFSFITSGIISFKQNAPLIIGILLTCVFISNMLTPLLAYSMTTNILSYLVSNITMNEISQCNPIQDLVHLSLPRLLNAEQAIILAVITGSITSYKKIKIIETTIEKIKIVIEYFITKFFIPILPLYIFGFLLELQYKGIFIELFQSYGKTYGLIILLQYFILFLLYFIAAGFNLSQTFSYIHTAIPSYITAFATMSSTAAIPITIQCAQKNIQNKALTHIATPILANIHMAGDAITVPTLALVTLFLFKGIIPTTATFITFVMYYSTTMLGASGIPGGAVIVMIPILKSILGFSDDMISIMITLHLLQDGFGTGGNVMGDGALMIIINKILMKLGVK